MSMSDLATAVNSIFILSTSHGKVILHGVSPQRPKHPVSRVKSQTWKSSPSVAQHDLRIGSSPPPAQVIIVSTKRSGSSFVGELFNSNPQIFYLFEPLCCITFDVLYHRLSWKNVVKESLNIWNHILRCNYSTSYPKPTKWVQTERFNMCGKSNALSRSSSLCERHSVPPEKVGYVISQLCLDHSFAVFKTIRVMDIKELQSFFEDPTLNMKILHLIRDPRAVMNSRWKLEEENVDLILRKGKDADEILDLCQHMARNLKYRDNPPSWLKGKYIMVRFEDIARNPVEETKRIYSALGLSIHQDVMDWIEQNTNQTPEEANPFSRQRNTSAVVTAWKDSIPTAMRKDVEKKCRHVIRKLAYDIL
ncbi:carbohydrate sulfotransferase 1-like [Diadema antillarum]|uniref:carbohydrate sulfotransferase 1-like n=1 Tax=Diadema antillarum TaxID=105358 RepID=UPI003A85CE42